MTRGSFGKSDICLSASVNNSGDEQRTNERLLRYERLAVRPTTPSVLARVFSLPRFIGSRHDLYFTPETCEGIKPPIPARSVYVVELTATEGFRGRAILSFLSLPFMQVPCHGRLAVPVTVLSGRGRPLGTEDP